MKRRFHGGIAHRRARRSLIAGAAAALWAALPAAHAVELGVLHLHSGIGQPLDAEIDLTGLRPEDAQTLVLQPGGRDAYLAAGLPYGASATSLRTALVRRQDGRYAVRVSSTVAHSDPIADVIVSVGGPGGDKQAAYTVLLSPPGTAGAPDTFLQTQHKETPASAVSPARSATAPRPDARPVATASAPAASAPVTQQTDEPKAPAAIPASPSGEHDEGAANAYTIKAGDNLSAIASHVFPDRGEVSGNQAWLALYRSNPQAFIGGDINRLRVGATLQVPSQEQAVAVARAEADRQVHRLTHADADVRADARQPSEAASSTGAEPRATPADTAGKNTLRLSATGGAQSGMTTEQLNDELVAARQRIRELESRLAQVEQNVADMQRLAALKSAQPTRAAAPAPTSHEQPGDASKAMRAKGAPPSSDDTPLWARADIVSLALGGGLAVLLAALVLYRVRMRKVQSALATIYTQFNHDADPLTERGRPLQRKDESAKTDAAVPHGAMSLR